MLRARTPFGAWVEGLIAGAVGAGAQTLFFRATRSMAPKPTADAYQPPEPQQQEETATETVARRIAEGLAQRGPLDARAKQRGADLLHYGFGAAWGGLYGLLRASYPAWRGPLGLAGFSALVWMAGDNLLLPAVRLAGWPHRYPPRTHAYALAAHLAYGAGLGGTLALVDRVDTLAGLAVLAAARGLVAGRHAAARGRALVPRELIERPRRLAERIARWASERRPS